MIRALRRLWRWLMARHDERPIHYRLTPVRGTPAIEEGLEIHRLVHLDRVNTVEMPVVTAQEAFDGLTPPPEPATDPILPPLVRGYSTDFEEEKTTEILREAL